MKKYVCKFVLLLIIMFLCGCNSNEQSSIELFTTEIKYTPISVDEMEALLLDDFESKEYGLNTYVYEGKVVNIKGEYVDFQNKDFVIRTRIADFNGLEIEVGRNYIFNCKLRKYSNDDCDTIYMRICIIEEVDKVDTKTYTSISNVEELLSLKNSRFELTNIIIENIKKNLDEDGNLIDSVICFKVGEETVAIKLPGAEDFNFDIQKGDTINLCFNNFINKECDSLKEDGIDYLLTDYYSISYEKIVD